MTWPRVFLQIHTLSWDSVYWVTGDLLWPACTDRYLQGSQMKLKIDQTMWQFSAAIFSSMNRMFSIIFFLFVQSCKWEIIWLKCWLVLPRNLPSPTKGESPRSTSGVLEGERVGVWPAVPYLGTEECGKSADLSLSVDVGLGTPVFSGDLRRLLAGKPSGSGVAPEHWEQKWGSLGLGQILSRAWSAKQFRSTLGH